MHSYTKAVLTGLLIAGLTACTQVAPQVDTITTPIVTVTSANTVDNSPPTVEPSNEGEDTGAEAPTGQQPAEEGTVGIPDSYPSGIVTELDVSDVTAYSAAMAAQVAAGDGAGIDDTFRNSGVVIDEQSNLYYAVNGVHPVRQGDYTSYYPKSIIAASLADDTLVRAYEFSSAFGHDVDMEGLTFADNRNFLYIGDEYNYIYELDLSSGELTQEWNLAAVGVSTAADRGIEALTYSRATGYFYAGIQDSGDILVLDLADGGGITQVGSFRVPGGGSPSGLFAHADGSLYVITLAGGGPNASQRISRLDPDGNLLCEVSIPPSLNIARPDGIFIDSTDSYVYIVDSQGPLFGGNSLYRVGWGDPCN